MGFHSKKANIGVELMGFVWTKLGFQRDMNGLDDFTNKMMRDDEGF